MSLHSFFYCRPFFWLVVLLGGFLQIGCDSRTQREIPPHNIPSPSSISRDAGETKPSFGSMNRISSDSRPRIVAFGDSLTAGKGLPLAEAYPAQLQRRLDESGYRYQVINAGVSGETSAGGVRRLDQILELQPQIVILELGANDGLRGVPIAHIYRNLEAIIQRLQKKQITILLAGMDLPRNYGETYVTEFRAIYPRLAQKYGIPLIPFILQDVAGRPHLNQEDGIHPTAEGYQIVVDNVMAILEPMLKHASRSSNQRAILYSFLKKISYTP